MYEFKPEMINAQYIYDAFKLIEATPETDDLNTGMAKLDVIYNMVGKEIPNREAKKEMGEFLGRPQSGTKRESRFMIIAKASKGTFAEFEKVVNDFIKEDLMETPELL